MYIYELNLQSHIAISRGVNASDYLPWLVLLKLSGARAFDNFEVQIRNLLFASREITSPKKNLKIYAWSGSLVCWRSHSSGGFYSRSCVMKTGLADVKTLLNSYSCEFGWYACWIRPLLNDFLGIVLSCDRIVEEGGRNLQGFDPGRLPTELVLDTPLAVGHWAEASRSQSLLLSLRASSMTQRREMLSVWLQKSICLGSISLQAGHFERELTRLLVF
jgi:hypothetical protein